VHKRLVIIALGSRREGRQEESQTSLRYPLKRGHRPNCERVLTAARGILQASHV
jgi:hypothetical protein